MISDLDSATWTNPWFMKLSLTGKLLYFYLNSCAHKNVTGLYYITPNTIASDTAIPIKNVLSALKALSPKVNYDFKHHVVWVRDHILDQFYKTGKLSPKIAVHITKNLIVMAPHPFIEQLLNYYPTLQNENLLHTLSCIRDTLSNSTRYPTGEGEDAGKGKGEDKSVSSEEDPF